MSGGAPEQAHDADFPVGLHVQPPLAVPVSESAIGKIASRLQVLRCQHHGLPSGYRQPHLLRRARPAVVRARDRHAGRRVAGIDDPQQAALTAVAGGVEVRNQMRPSPLALPNHIVQAGQESAVGAPVRRHHEIQTRRENKAPVAVAVAGPPFQALVRVAVFQVVRVEVLGLEGADAQRDRIGRFSRIVDGMHQHLAGGIGTVDDAHEALAGHVAAGEEHRHLVAGVVANPVIVAVLGLRGILGERIGVVAHAVAVRVRPFRAVEGKGVGRVVHAIAIVVRIVMVVDAVAIGVPPDGGVVGRVVHDIHPAVAVAVGLRLPVRRHLEPHRL